MYRSQEEGYGVMDMLAAEGVNIITKAAWRHTHTTRQKSVEEGRNKEGLRERDGRNTGPEIGDTHKHKYREREKVERERKEGEGDFRGDYGNLDPWLLQGHLGGGGKYFSLCTVLGKRARSKQAGKHTFADSRTDNNNKLSTHTHTKINTHTPLSPT